MSLIAENIGFWYEKNNWLFQNVNFELKRGEVVGISGYSGCGKSTFAKVMANYLSPIAGRVVVDNKAFVKGSYQPVQMIYQHPEKALNPKWRMYRSLTESYQPDQEILDRFGIREEWYHRYPVEISGGEMQRFCIVRALAPETKFLIADEMTTMLDAVTQAKIWKELIKICRERNLGLMIISHETELLAKLCDRILSVQEMQCGV
ncbi:ABC transporter ATP-binding protein [Anaerotignum sp. MB30-C6]|uniref:ABC transporter ATP-binding protein n=1 Tax=Anaerotignum sp. MB30-C6 TaxID=3070814 RepID=UPI0027DC466E|nr:ATP-binding cassette domain-containing protein [Anaerotignum sp. MB30-C6]WMI79905.1 ATP-binding cassette domain-containing protein [Anaerotignum sp. MB30-C6]